jgi:hypothetical protein
LKMPQVLTCRGRGLARSFCGELLSGRFATRALSSCLLCSGHFREQSLFLKSRYRAA